MVMRSTCHGKQLEIESIYPLTEPTLQCPRVNKTRSYAQEDSLVTGRHWVSLLWLKAYEEVPAPQAGTGITLGSREQAPEVDWMEFIPAHQGTEWKEGTSNTRLPSFNSNNQNWLMEQATPSRTDSWA